MSGLRADEETLTTREAWERQLSDAIPCVPPGDEEPPVEDDWVSPMAGLGLPAVVMDWSALDWSQSRRAT